MKRDMDLVRKILLEVEKASNQYYFGIELSIEGHNEQEIEYHLILLQEAGLIELDENRAFGESLKPTRLTWEGHEFLDASRNNNIWSKAKDIAAKTGSTAFPVLLQILIELGKAEAAKYLPK